MEYLLLATVGLLLIVFMCCQKRHVPLAFPGPRGWPLLGAFFEMRGKEIHKILSEWVHRYGPAFKFSMLGREFLVVSDPDTLTEVLVTRGKSFGGRLLNVRTIDTGVCRALINCDNLAHTALLRKAVHPCIQPYGSERAKLSMTLTSSVHLLLDNFRISNGQAINPVDSIHKATTLTVFKLLCGEELGDVNSLYREVDKLQDAMNKFFTPNFGHLLLDEAPWLKYLPRFPPYQNVLRFSQQQDKIFDCIVLPALDKSDDSQDRTIGKAFLKAVGQKYGEGEESGEITMDTVKLTMVDFIIAGTFTTASVFSSLILILQHHPDIQQKAYEEIMEEIGSEKMIDFDDKGKLPYCQAIVWEVLRYAPVAPVGVFHVTKEDTSLKGVEVPKGTTVITNIWGCHHDPELWTDPWDFKPERFLDDDGQLVLPDHAIRKQCFPFGAGTRACVGQVFALNRLFVFLANCLQMFQFVPPDGSDPRLGDVRNFPFTIIMGPPAFVTRAVPRM